MKLIVHRQWKVCDGSDECKAGIIPAGVHEVEEIPPPDKVKVKNRGNWIVLKGTLIGATREFWKQWSNTRFGIHQVEIIEDH